MADSPGPTQRMSAVDRAWLRMDDPTHQMIINGVTLLGAPLKLEEMRGMISERLVGLPRFQWRVEPTNGKRGHVWKAVDDFDLSAHVVSGQLDPPGGQRALEDFVSRRMSEGIDFSKPPWKIYLIEDYDGGSVVLWRLHHCLGDGIAMMLVMLSLTEVEAASDTPGEAAIDRLEDSPLRALFGPEQLDAETAKGHLAKVMPQAVELLSRPAETVQALSWWKKGAASVPALGRLALRPPATRRVFKGKLGIGKRAAWSRGIPLEQVKQVGKTLGGTVNDILTNAVAGALRRYALGRGESVDNLSFRAVVPVNLRPLEEMASLGNQFGLVFLALPLGIGDSKERLAELRRRMDRIKKSFEPVVVLKILGIMGAAPMALQRLTSWIFGAKGTAVFTNVPGPTKRLYLAGKPVKSFIFWVPQSGGLGMGISISSYAGEVRLGLSTDAGLVPDPETIIEAFHAEFDEMLALAGQGSGPSADPTVASASLP